MRASDGITEAENIAKQQYEMDLIVLVYNLNDISYLSPKTKPIYDRIFSWEDKLNYLEKNSYCWIGTYFDSDRLGE